GAVDDAEVLAAACLERRLGEAAAAASDELERLDDHTLAPALRELGPPRAAGALALGLGGVDDEVGGGVEQLVAGAELRERLHVPEMILVDVDGSLTGEQMERSELEVVDGPHRPAVAAVGVDETSGVFSAGACALE